ncbi:MAG TPA: GNAT family N-acetyltransferase [Thermoanaerobaculia bacterium]
MNLRTATHADAAWINDRYAEVHFIPSDFDRDTIVVAELDGTRAGMGRLVPAGEHAYELGGMYVSDEHRGRGIARAIIDELITLAGDADIYCIPFANLTALYASAGFVPSDRATATDHVRAKLDWCARELPEREVVLLRYQR